MDDMIFNYLLKTFQQPKANLIGGLYFLRKHKISRNEKAISG